MYFSIFSMKYYDIQKLICGHLIFIKKYDWDDLFKVIVVLVGEFFCKINLFFVDNLGSVLLKKTKFEFIFAFIF
jgi:hypothetical protein